MQVSDTKNNRGAHGDSSSKLSGLPLSSENPPGFSRGECQRWSLEHPLLTNARKFEETFGLKLWKTPRKIVASYNGEIFIPIPDEWWDAEYEEP